MKISGTIKTPVRVEEQGYWFALLYDAENVRLGKIMSQPQAHAIARAINCHDRLVEYLKLSGEGRICAVCRWSPHADDCELCALLAEATGEQNQRRQSNVLQM